MRYKYNFNEETGRSTYTIFYKGIPFTGHASVSPNDEDMKSEKTGLFIAETRAYISYLKHIKNNEIKPKLIILKHLIDSFDRSSYSFKKSYENKAVRKQLQITEKQLATIDQEIADEEQYLKFYIERKDSMYKRIRSHKDKND